MHPPPPPGAPRAATPARRLQVLVADDNVINQRIGVRLLQELGQVAVEYGALPTEAWPVALTDRARVGFVSVGVVHRLMVKAVFGSPVDRNSIVVVAAFRSW